MLTGGNNNNGDAKTNAKIYNIGTSSWSNARAMSQKRLRHGCTSVTREDGSVMGVVVGGYNTWPSGRLSDEQCSEQVTSAIVGGKEVNVQCTFTLVLKNVLKNSERFQATAQNSERFRSESFWNVQHFSF